MKVQNATLASRQLASVVQDLGIVVAASGAAAARRHGQHVHMPAEGPGGGAQAREPHVDRGA